MSRYCLQCGKSQKACICQWIQSLSSNVELIILQHPTEEHRPMGTARILSLSLPNSYLFVGEDFSTHDELNHLLAQSDVEHYILYPSDHSRSADELIAKANTDKVRVILLDGTWKKAYKMWQVSTNLQSLPCLHLPKGLKGNYRIRKAPSENSLSTVEAGYHILSLLQHERDFSPLLAAFDHMIQFQIDQMPPGVFERNYLK
ncbi:DTW domain-containing protein [Vibrio sp. SCSIO 43135]|uniref:tRNA-uridine aminocarboxypropyltransferase n=1 Tax=Vibrio sp. SCSIO 43135 TaxID=2819096 RepID=UPI00207606DB|nr:DTW domain-containing protein [Vibrio sp. SCSIO 43135]USD41994.1 DTW domain-containing protein [Vibrio sp. SCSIO 43135]